MKTVNAILVILNIRMFSNQRQDKNITDEVKIKKALGDGAGKWVKYKLPDECLSTLRKFAGEVRKFHYDHTSPWDDGQRLLSGRARDGYDQQMNAFKDQWDELVDEFVSEYPNWVEEAKIMHAGTFNAADYPDVESIRHQFDIVRTYSPVPKPEHFNADMRELYGQGLVALTEERIGKAVQDAWDRLLKPVQAMAEKLGSKDKIFRDSLVENVSEITALIPALNLTNDPKLTEAAKLIDEQLANLDVEALRENKVERKAAAEAAEKILTRFGGIGKRKLASN